MCLGTAEPQPSCPGCTPVRKLYLEQSILGQGKERSQRRREKKALQLRQGKLVICGGNTEQNRKSKEKETAPQL